MPEGAFYGQEAAPLRNQKRISTNSKKNFQNKKFPSLEISIKLPSLLGEKGWG
jgi:hypothetical protein